MKVALLFPPYGGYTYPYSSLPTLAGYLRSIGHEVVQLDAGARVVDRMLTGERLGAFHKTVTARIEELSALKRLTRKQRDELYNALAVDLFAADVIGKIERAKAVFRSKELFYRTDEYRRAANLVRRAFEIISAASLPTKLNHIHVIHKERMTLEYIHALAPDPKRNPFLETMRDELVPWILEHKPALAGISIAYEEQLVAGYALAGLIKSAAPECHVAIGGATITLGEGTIRRDPLAFKHVDSYVFGEGEGALARLIEIVESGGEIENEWPGVYLCSEGGSAPIAPAESGRGREDVDALPTPDYRGLNLEDYLSPETVFLIAGARGCYWNKCAFCGVSPSFKGGFKQRSLDLLKNDLLTLKERHGARFIDFTDEGIAPKRLARIAEFLAGLDSPTFWQTMARYEQGFTPELLERLGSGGCRVLSFGHESACQRVLDLMRKGTRFETGARLIRDVSSAGIAVSLQSFLGFPGETEDEAGQSIEYLVSVRDHVATSAMGMFKLMEFAPAHCEPEAFGIEKIRRIDSAEIIPDYLYQTSSGAGRAEVKKSFKQAMIRMTEAYPGQYILLDGSFGAHLLLLVARFDQTKVEDIFRREGRDEGIHGKRPALLDTILKRRIKRRGVVLYNPANARMLWFGLDYAPWLELMDGGATVAGIQKDLIEEGGVEAAMTFLTIAYDLFHEGFIDML